MERTDRDGSARARLAYHGGDLAAARKLFPNAPLPWLDLSTGINPWPYPIGDIAPECFRRLPGREAVAALEAAAAAIYRARGEDGIVAAPGTQSLIQLLPHLHPARRVGILGFTYGDHARAWSAIGADVVTVERLEALAECDVAVVVNPNNPDGRLVPPQELCALAEVLSRKGGLLVIDEAFMDVIEPDQSLVPILPRKAAVVLRSFGKTYGLAGLRLGFAVAPMDIAMPIRESLGPWAVSGAAIEIGIRALRDYAWLEETRSWLKHASSRLDRLLVGAGCSIVGGTPLFRLAAAPDGPALFEALAALGILVRPFPHRPDWLRFGLCDDEAAWKRVAAALSSPR